MNKIRVVNNEIIPCDYSDTVSYTHLRAHET